MPRHLPGLSVIEAGFVWLARPRHVAFDAVKSGAAMGKNQKKKGQTLSLAEFTSDTVAADPMALPTAPREQT